MIAALALILVCQLFGEVLADLFGIPIPGPVLGLVILFLGLLVCRGSTKVLDDTAESLLKHFSILFVPAGVGVITQLDRLRGDWLPIVGAVVLSTCITIAVTGFIMAKLLPTPSDSETKKD